MRADTTGRPANLNTELVVNDEHIRPLVKDLHRVRPGFYWADFGLSAMLGWTAFSFAVRGFTNPLLLTGCGLLALAGLYRCLCFIHELSHQTERSLPHFERFYNWTIGYPLLMPSFLYVGMHQSHHRIDVYGTSGDPEYLPFSKSWLMTVVFACESVLIPLILLVRFVVVSPIGFLWPKAQRWLVIHFSSLTMNPQFRRADTAPLMRKVRQDSAIIWCVWVALLASSWFGPLGWHWLAVWFLVDAGISFINTLRTLGAHGYESDGQPMDREAQLRDSIDTPGAFWTELWAPVGLRYHALHHYFPGIPYHNLPEAYRRIVHCLPVAEGYRQMSSESLPHSLQALLQRGWRNFGR